MGINSYGAPRTSREETKKALATHDQAAYTAWRARLRFRTNGLWLLASRINHACIGNCHRSQIGDMHIIRAARDLEAGTELLAPCRLPEPMETYREVQAALCPWGFTCACELCLMKKATTAAALARRKMLNRQLRKVLYESATIDVAAAERLLVQMEKTYPVGDFVHRKELWRLYMRLSHHVVSSKPVDGIAMLIKGLGAIGFDIDVTLPGKGRKPSLNVTRWGAPSRSTPAEFFKLYKTFKQLAPEVCDTIKRYVAIAHSIDVGEEETVGDEYRFA